MPSSWRRIGIGKKMRDARKLWSLYQAMGKLGADQPEAIELLTGAARPILDRWFKSDVLKATLATDAIIGAFLSISSPGSAYVLLHHVMGEAGGGLFEHRETHGVTTVDVGEYPAALVRQEADISESTR
mgnify:CR=1 FL=1